MLLWLLALQSSVADDTQPVPLTEEQKQRILIEFKTYHTAEQAYIEARNKKHGQSDAIQSARPSPEEACTGAENQQACIKNIIETYASDDRYERQSYMGRHLVFMTFINDSAFTLKISGGTYIGDMEKSAVEERVQIILDHYLGNGYESFEPRVSIIKPDYVGIDLFLNPDELSHYLSDERLNYIATPAEKQIINRP